MTTQIKDNREWYKLRLGEMFYDCENYVMRVPGGWIVTEYHSGIAKVFIPYNNEFKPKE